MSMRVKAALVIMSIVFGVTVAFFFLSLSFTSQNLVKTIEQDLSLVRDIADDLVATKIRLLKSDGATVAERLLNAGSTKEMTELMELQLDEFPDFISLTVYDRQDVIVNCGEPISDNIFAVEDNNIQVAFDGESIFSTTHYNIASGTFIMHLFVPMGEEFVLSATVSGMLFADLLSGYRLWRTGNLFILDESGTFIAHFRHDMVLNRYNFVEESKINPDYRVIGEFYQNMLTTEEGSGTYNFEGVERLCIYKHITGSRAGWRIAISVPLDESPLVSLRKDLLFSALYFMIAGVLISIFVSGLVARPFYKIEEQNRSLAELNESVRAASEAKSNFLARMSHEMRTPLNAIIGLSSLALEANQLNDETSSNLEKINNAGTTLLSTVNDILDISKIEAGKLELVTAEYEVASILNDTITQSILHIGEKPIKFALEIDENLPIRLCGDDLRVKQIMNNLLSNAFKYTKEGTVELNVSCNQDNDTVWLIARIRDSGIGIRSEDVGNLFSEYAQMDVKSNRKVMGTGLGLPIVKRLAEIMDGSITVESEYGKGSVFTVQVKQKFVTDKIIGAEVVNSLKNFRFSDQKRRNGSALLRINLSYVRVLVVDDVETNLDVAKGMMKPYKMKIDCRMSGREAIDAIRNEEVRYNAIFMDHMMPEMDGIEAVRIIREEIGTEYAKTVPIIALTANAILGNEEMFLSNGFQAFLSKPIEIGRLDAVLRQWVRDKTLEAELKIKENELPEMTTVRTLSFQVDGVDLQKGLDRFGGDEESYLQILRSYTTNTPRLLTVVKGLNKENLADYAITVHGIKSSSRSIGAESVGSKAEALEKAAKEGDFNFVTANNSVFIFEIKNLVDNLAKALEQITPQKQKTKKDKPGREDLLKLRAACESFDMDSLEAAMAQIETYEYEKDGELVTWLRENADQLNFSEITEKLSAIA
ncbi:MAG: response regulator [Treponema sp.]|nr:response regulator [Treponema sp.]